MGLQQVLKDLFNAPKDSVKLVRPEKWWVERLILAIDIDNILKIVPDIYMISIGDDAIQHSFKIAHQLRENKKLNIVNDSLRRNIKAQMKDANRLQAKYVIIIGEEEIASNQFIVKNMNSGEQKKLSIDKVIEHFK